MTELDDLTRSRDAVPAPPGAAEAVAELLNTELPVNNQHLQEDPEADRWREDIAALAAQDTRPPPAPADRRYINWSDFWATDYTQHEYVIPDLIPRGEACTIFAPRGDGKSLVSLEMAAAVATGGVFAGKTVTQRTVLYIDLDQTPATVQDRLRDMGYSERIDLSRLHYSMLGDWTPLDTPQGGAELAAEVARLTVDFVIIDTLGRAVEGPENDNDTFLRFNRSTTQLLTREGVALLRLDNSGKDLSRGQRGASAKEDDGNLIYQLTDTGLGEVELKRTKNRIGLDTPERITWRRQSNPLRHVTTGGPVGTDEHVTELIRELDRLDVDPDAGRHIAGSALRDAGIKVRTNHLAEAVRRRKTR